MDPESVRIDKTKLEIAKVSTCPDDTAYWLSKTPDERFAAAELMRWINYGDKTTERLQRILEVTKRT